MAAMALFGMGTRWLGAGSLSVSIEAERGRLAPISGRAGVASHAAATWRRAGVDGSREGGTSGSLGGASPGCAGKARGDRVSLGLMSVRRSDTYLLDRGGQVLAGRYRVTELLGVGAMGSVWIAEQLALKRQVVVKFHEEGFVGNNSDVAYERFRREARTLASVQHRNVTELFEAGKTPEAEPYLIMERLRGRTLAARMRSERLLPVDDAFGIAAEIASGLEAVHAAGVLHRDIKPENIYLHDAGEEDGIIPKLIDFGLARPETGKRLTMGNKAVGTPGYMAPEQARGTKNLDGRVDLYALGVTLYEMLTGNLPSQGETMVDLMIWTATEEPIPITDYRPDLSGPLADVVMRCIAREIGSRYPDAKTMRRALEGAISIQRAAGVADTAPGDPDERGRRARAETEERSSIDPRRRATSPRPSEAPEELSNADLKSIRPPPIPRGILPPKKD